MTSRANEIGIRMALGQRRSAVVFDGHAGIVTLVAMGILFGLATSLAADRFTSTLLYGLSPHDHLPSILASMTMIAVSAFASYLPARRASRVDPVATLHYE